MMSPELTALRDEAMRVSCESWAIQKRWVLSRGVERAGPCPVCGGKDRFSINTRENLFNCRKCGIAGGGVIDLVVKTEGLSFIAACELITGRKAEAPVDEQRMEALRRQAAADEAKRQQVAERYRERARERGYQIWHHDSGPPTWPIYEGGSSVPRYLALRDIAFGFADHEAVAGKELMLREIAEHPWRETIEEPDGNKVLRTVHSGPAMIAAVQLPDGRFGAVHQTWLDLAQPKGKVLLPPDDKGHERPSKKVLGAKKGGAIRLYTPDKPRRMVMGEGIETTLTALAHAYEPETAYWAGVDGGNMAGRAQRDAENHVLHDQPDMDDAEAFVPPDWVEELVFLCDGDDAAAHPVEKMTRGLRRAALRRPGLSIALVPPVGAGKDLNDLVRVSG